MGHDEKVMALLMAALLMLALAGCGENKNNTNRPGSNSNNTTNGSNDADKGNGTVNDGLTDSNGAARNGRSSYGTYRDKGNDDAFNNNHGSTFGGVGEELKEDAQQFPPTVWDSMTGNHGASGTATWRQMLDNGFVHDTDGFLLDGEKLLVIRRTGGGRGVSLRPVFVLILPDGTYAVPR